MAWWNKEYLLRRKVIINPYSGDLIPGQDIIFPLPVEEFINLNKSRGDYQDIEVLYQPNDDMATPTYQVLSRFVDEDSVTFPIVENIEEGIVSTGEYWIYYGNPDLDAAPARPAYVVNPWPVVVDHESSRVTYTRPFEHWIDGRSSTLNAKATFNFTGSNIRLLSEYGPDQGQIAVYLDGEIYGTFDLWSPVVQDQVVLSEIGLVDTEHVIQIINLDEKEPKSAGTEVNILRFEYAESYISIDGGEEFNAIDWVTYSGGLD